MKYKITITVEPAPDAELIGIKEDFATYCEKFGDVRNVTVEEVKTEQMKMRL